MSITRHRPGWDQTRIQQAEILAKRSLCTRDQVGAIIVDAGNKVIGEGYNGPPSGFKTQETSCTNWCQRAKLKPKEEWSWSADMSHASHLTGSIEVDNDGFWWVYGERSVNPGHRIKMERDIQWEARGFTKLKKPGFTMSPTYDDCPSLHAEANALITSDRSLRVGGTIYITSDICMGCAKLIANSGLTRVYVKAKRYDEHRNPKASYDFLRECGLTVHVHRPTTRGTDDRAE